MNLLTKQFKTITIDSNTYQLSMLKGREGFRTAMELGKVVAPVLGATFDGVRHDDYIHGAPRTFTQLALLLIDQMDKIDVESIIFDRLLRGMAVNGKEVNVDEFFMSNYSVLVEVIAFALKENFGDFFGENGFKARFLETVKNVFNQTQTDS